MERMISDPSARLQTGGQLSQERIERSEFVIDRDPDRLKNATNRVLDQIIGSRFALLHKVGNDVCEIGCGLERVFGVRF